MNNPKFNDYEELEIKDTTDAPKWDNYPDLSLEFDKDGKLFTRLYDKRETLISLLSIFHLYLSSNSPESPACGVFCFTVDTLFSGLFEI